jgi:hypothetical protein
LDKGTPAGRMQRALTASQIFHQELKKQAKKVEFLAVHEKKQGSSGLKVRQQILEIHTSIECCIMTP